MDRIELDRIINDLLQLEIDGYPFAPTQDPFRNAVIYYDSANDVWDYIALVLTPQGGSAVLDTGYDLSLDGNILLSTGATVDGVDIDSEVLTVSGGPDYSPVANAMFYWDSGTSKWKVGKSDLLNGGNTALHYHDSDRNRANHTGTQTASTISDFDTEVSNNTDVAANTTNRHSHPKFFGRLRTSFNINGLWQDLPLFSTTKDAITHTNGSAEIAIDSTGYYLLQAESVNNDSTNNTQIMIKFQLDTGSGYSDLSNSLRETHTSNAGRNYIGTTVGPVLLNAGDKIKAQVRQSSYITGRTWLASECVVSIHGEVDE